MIPGSTKEHCFLCGRSGNTEIHHIYGGVGRRSIADQYDLTVPLCMECHRGTNGVHGKNGADKAKYLHESGQQWFELLKESEGMTEEEARNEFRKLFGRSYL